MKKSKLTEKYKKVIGNPGSNVKLICIKGYNGTYQCGIGSFFIYAYKVGQIKKRNEIFLKPKNWKIYEN